MMAKRRVDEQPNVLEEVEACLFSRTALSIIGAESVMRSLARTTSPAVSARLNSKTDAHLSP